MNEYQPVAKERRSALNAPNQSIDAPQDDLARPLPDEKRHMVMIFALLLTAICLTVSGELLLKAAMNRVGEFSLEPAVVIRTFTEWRVILSFALIFGGSLFWLGVVSRVDFSFAYPLLAMSYVISLLPAWLFLGEHVTWNRIVGALVIVVGVVIVTRR